LGKITQPIPREILKGSRVSVYVNNAQKPSLEVERLSATTHGGLGLWVGNNSAGSFANLTFTPGNAKNVSTANPPPSYGNNPAAGHYLDVGDARLYYEIYGSGKPIALLHGGVYGYIDEFEPFITRLSAKYQVICVGTRGHGKSDIGHTPFTWQQRAEDAYKVIRAVTKDSVMVLGFSDGGHGALKLAALHPELVKKLIAIGAGDYPSTGPHNMDHYTPQQLMKSDSAFFAGRLALMPEPNRWAEDLDMMSKLYNEDFISTETFSRIKCPTLIMAGDKDDYNSIESIVNCKKAIPNAQLSIIAGCWHVVFFCNFPAVWDTIEPFLSNS
jgi:pimeloyl-ACP methyl ester carboxylesterase